CPLKMMDTIVPQRETTGQTVYMSRLLTDGCSNLISTGQCRFSPDMPEPTCCTSDEPDFLCHDIDHL
ncbi:hypothetical protein, partial [Pantoea dispersa]|uniref:hypothetical protein n=1 Tax=Pantoea dispersa TaxID=59814 RepID=UPI001C8B6034